MPDVRLAATFLRELGTYRHAPRTPPSPPLTDPVQLAQAMADGGGATGRTAPGYLFHSERIARTVYGARRCADLGCGTGVQLLQVARRLPDTHFVGVDAAPQLLEIAAADAARHGIDNVEWLQDDLRTLTHLRPVDAVISTMTLHHLPDAAALDEALCAAADRLQPAGAVYLEDFGRLKCRMSMEHFAAMNEPVPRDRFGALYRASLASAFTAKELRQAAQNAFDDVRIYRTFILPFLVVIKTADRITRADARRLFDAERAALDGRQSADLAELERFFALGGLR